MDYNNKEKALVAGYTPSQLVQMLDGNEAEFAAKALNYLDGKQEQELVAVLNDSDKGRKDWKKRGFIARHRNLTKMIVEKSGMLFKDSTPLLEIRANGSKEVNTAASESLMNLLDATEWQEVMINMDSVVRLLKTAILLVQWDDNNQTIVFDILHRANCNVIIDPLTKQIAVLIQRTGCSGDSEYYRVWTAETIYDLVTVSQKTSVVDESPNSYGAIPATVFYDTTSPRAGFWVEAARDLVNVNEMYNLHLTDSEFAISWAKRPSLFTNCSLDGYSDESLEVVSVPGSVLPRSVSRSPSITGGPDIAIVLGSSNGDAPFIDYKSPQIDIKPMDEVVQGWIKQTAADWSVRVRADGEKSANSGFQVVVEEVPNLELRQTRARMFEASFKRLYRALVIVTNGALPADQQLFAVFPKPNLPVDPKEEEAVWTMKITAGRATEIDYFVEVKGLTPDEAMAKWIEITEFNAAKTKITSAIAPEVDQEATEDVAEEDQSEGDIPANA